MPSVMSSHRSATFGAVVGALLSALSPRPASALFYPSIVYGPPIAIGPGTTYRTATSASPLWQIRIVEVDLSNPNVELTPVRSLNYPAREVVSSMAARVKAIASVNGGYFDTTGAGGAYSYLAIDGQVIAHNASWRPPRSTFGMWGGHNAALVGCRLDGSDTPNPAAEPDWARVIDGMGGAPNLVTSGTVDVTEAVEQTDTASGSGINTDVRNPRTALGWVTATRRVFLVTVDGRQPAWSVGMTATELARLMLDLGCDRAINYDGGGSTECWIAGQSPQIVNHPSDGTERLNQMCWAVVPSNIVDNADAECAVSGAWGPSSNPGFYDRNSLVKTAGSGTASVTWTPNLVSGRFEVYAWWVADLNRTTAATYLIHHNEGESTSIRDQTLNGRQWNLLGTHNFAGGTGGFVTLTDLAVAGLFVSADAVKFVKVGDYAPAGIADYSVY